MPTKLTISNAAADPAKWDTAFKTKLAEAGDAKFFTQKIFAKYWGSGLKALFVSPSGAALELTIDEKAKTFSWLIKPKDAKAGNDFFAEHPTLKAVASHKGVVSGAPEEDPAKKLDALYHPLFETVDEMLAKADEPGKVVLKAMQAKIQEAKAKGNLDTKPLATVLTQVVEKVKKEVAARKADPATNVVPPNAAELEKQRAIDEIKYRQKQRDMQKAAEKLKAEAAAATAKPAAEEAEDPDRWVPTVGDLPLYGSLNDAQKAYVRAKLDDFNSRGKGGGAHKGVGGVVTLDMTGPAWGTSGRGAWRLQIMSGSKTLNIVDHAGKTWK